MSEWLQGIIDVQRDFETKRVGTDGSLFDNNNVPFLFNRGLIGETVEAYDAWQNGTSEELTDELSDVLIFYAAILLHTGIDAAQVEASVSRKLKVNDEKYDPSFFEGVTVREGIKKAREAYKDKPKGVSVE